MEYSNLISLSKAIDVPTNLSISKVKIIDLGAGVYNTNLSYQSLIDLNLAHVIGFEPNPDELQKMLANKPENFDYLPYAVGDGKDATFNLTVLPQCSSLYEPNRELLDLFSGLRPRPGRPGAFGVVKRLPVQTRRLDDIPNCAHSDYIKMDMQGAELDILKGAIETLKTTLIIEVEVEFIPLYQNQPLFGDLQCFLREQNFMFHKLLNIQGRPIAPMTYDKRGLKTYSQALWADAIFIRESLLRNPTPLTGEQLLKSALILNDVYHSYDLVYHLLSYYDSRFGTQTASDYANAVKKVPTLKRSYMNLIDELRDLEAG
ncbi:MAG: FkbM family methyltransferase [Hormoscilla sp. GM7CHS1pb]|nr:FkbM family methyltransferase [Hormoscilla sp. GM7CHS1pb]